MKKFKIPFINKKSFKRRHRQCQICGEEKYELLDTHRVMEGGKYEETNCVCLCISCHRKHHSGLITIKKWFHSTSGKLLLYIDEEGYEQFV